MKLKILSEFLSKSAQLQFSVSTSVCHDDDPVDCVVSLPVRWVDTGEDAATAPCVPQDL